MAGYGRILWEVACETARYAVGSPASRKRQLDALRGLEDHQLDDIGVTRAEAAAGKPAAPARGFVLLTIYRGRAGWRVRCGRRSGGRAA